MIVSGLFGSLILSLVFPWSAVSAAGWLVTPPLQQNGVPRFEPAACMFTLPVGAEEGVDFECGYVIVPEQYSDPGGPTLRLAVALLKSQNPDPAPDPLVIAQGGPGGAAVELFSQILLDSRLRANRDLVIFDQRGTGLSIPALDCPEIMEETLRTLDVILEAEEASQRYNQAALACRERLVREGVNLAAYNSVENAADIDALRQALGYEEINLYGVSYGTLLALHTMRFYPEGLRSVILDAVLPPEADLNLHAPFNADRAFTQFFQACAKDGRCRAAYPDLEERFFALVERLNQDPAQIRLIDFETARNYAAVLDGDTLVWTLFQLLYASELIPLLPAVLERAYQGDFAPLETLVSANTFDRSVSQGMYWSVYCGEDGDFSGVQLDYSAIRPQLARDQEVSNRYTEALCNTWGAAELGPEMDITTPSPIPTLILNGQFDPITPPEFGEATAEILPNSISVTFPANGHSAIDSGDCAQEIMLAFLDQPGGDLDTACAAAQALNFSTGRDYVYLPVLPAINRLIAGDTGLLVGLLVFGLVWLFLLSALLIYPLIWLVRILGGRPADASAWEQRLAPWVAGGIALLVLVFILLLVWMLVGLVFENDIILILGLPGSARPLLLLPLLAGGLAALLLVITLRAWIDGKGGLFGRLYQVAYSLAAIGFVGALAFAGLFSGFF